MLVICIKCQIVFSIMNIKSQMLNTQPWNKFFRKQRYNSFDNCFHSEVLRYLDISIEEYKAQLKAGDVPADKFRFLSYMLSSKSISYDDVQAVMNSVFTDTLSTVSH